MKIVLISTLPVSLNCLFLLLFFLWIFIFGLSVIPGSYLVVFVLIFQNETCFCCLYSGSYLLKANGNLTGEKAMEMTHGFHFSIVMAYVTSCMMVGIFTNIKVISDFITNDWLNIMFPLIIYVKNLLFIKYTTFNLFLNAFYSEGQYYLGIWFLCYASLKTEGKLTDLLAMYICFYRFYIFLCKNFDDVFLSIIWVVQFLQKNVFFIVASRNGQMFLGIYILLILKGDCKLLF